MLAESTPPSPSRRRPFRRLVGVPVTVGMLALAPAASSGVPRSEHDGMHGGHHGGHAEGMMFGNKADYPNLRRAGAENRRQARALLRGTLRRAISLNTVAKAKRAGYRFDRRIERPTFIHMRKHGGAFWGGFLDPDTVQSLVYWCGTEGPCRLTGFMYRAPGDMTTPPTWGNILAWHKHGSRRNGWMTHVWILPKVRDAYASCAPVAALARARHFELESYDFTIDSVRPCPGDKPAEDEPAEDEPAGTDHDEHEAHPALAG